MSTYYKRAIMFTGDRFCRRPHRLIPVTSQGQCDKGASESSLFHLFSVVSSLIVGSLALKLTRLLCWRGNTLNEANSCFIFVGHLNPLSSTARHCVNVAYSFSDAYTRPEQLISTQHSQLFSMYCVCSRSEHTTHSDPSRNMLGFSVETLLRGII